MKKSYLIFLLLFLASIACACTKQGTTQDNSNDIPIPKFSTPVTIEELRTAFYRYSVPTIVKALVKNDWENYDYIFNKVASGNEDWIYAFTTFVAPGCDAASSEGVTIALAYALPNNPKVVLYLDYNTISPSLAEICTLPFIEPEYAFIKDYGERTLTALSNVDDPDLLDTRDMCIQRLKKSLQHCEIIYKKGEWKY